MRKEELHIRAMAENSALKEQLKLEKEISSDNGKVAQILHSRIHSAIAFIELQKFHFCNNNKCCEDGLNWLADEVKKILLGG